MARKTKLGPGGYPTPVPLVISVTGTVETAQVQSVSVNGKTAGKHKFGGAGTYSRIAELQEALVITGTVCVSQVQGSQSKVKTRKPALAEPKIPEIRGRVSTASACAQSSGFIAVFDPIVGTCQTYSGSQNSACQLNLAFFGMVSTEQMQSEKVRGKAEQWTEDDIALVLTLLAA